MPTTKDVDAILGTDEPIVQHWELHLSGNGHGWSVAKLREQIGEIIGLLAFRDDNGDKDPDSLKGSAIIVDFDGQAQVAEIAVELRPVGSKRSYVVGGEGDIYHELAEEIITKLGLGER